MKLKKKLCFIFYTVLQFRFRAFIFRLCRFIYLFCNTRMYFTVRYSVSSLLYITNFQGSYISWTITPPHHVPERKVDAVSTNLYVNKKEGERKREMRTRRAFLLPLWGSILGILSTYISISRSLVLINTCTGYNVCTKSPRTKLTEEPNQDNFSSQLSLSLCEHDHHPEKNLTAIYINPTFIFILAKQMLYLIQINFIRQLQISFIL